MPLLLLTPAALLLDELPRTASLAPAFLSGFLGAAGVFVMIGAYARAEAQLMIVFEYTGLFWAALLGWLVFAESPRPQIFRRRRDHSRGMHLYRHDGAALAAAGAVAAETQRILTPRAPSVVGFGRADFRLLFLVLFHRRRRQHGAAVRAAGDRA